MAHGGRMFHQGVHAPEGFRKREDLYPPQEGADGFAATHDFERHHGSVPLHLPLGNFMARMGYKPRVKDPAYLWVVLKTGSDSGRVFFLSLHSDRKRLDPSQYQPAVKRRCAG